VEKRLFEEGSDVRAGELFPDDRAYRTPLRRRNRRTCETSLA
jgi:hypothetical protein